MRFVLARSSTRFFRRHPWQLALALVGIGLGVAVFVGVQLANDSARRAFELSASALRGETTHRLLPVGDGLDESEYARLVLAGLGGSAAPVIEAQVVIEAERGARRPSAMLGIDPIEELGFRSYSSFAPTEGSSVERLLTEPGAILLPAPLADSLGAEVDDVVAVIVDGRSHRAHVVGTTVPIGTDVDSASPIVADIGSVQAWIGRVGKISRIDLALDASAAAALGDSAPSGTVLVPASSENSELAQLTRAFTTNLTALGLLALVVGMFLIYATISFAVVQRRRSMAIVRTIGLTRRQLLTSVLVEAAAIGLIGSLIGLVIGHGLATGLMDLVLRTLDDLYFRSTLDAAEPSGWIYVYGFVLGFSATLFSALVPALEAARSDPATAERRSSLERAAVRSTRIGALLALPCAGTAGLLLAMNEQSLLLAFLALFLVLAGGALTIPLATAGLASLLERLGRGFIGVPGAMAIRGVTASLSRTGVATAALAVAVATVISIGLMIGSFRATLIDWIELSLTADLYVSLDGSEQEPASIEAAISVVEDFPDIEGVSLSRVARVPSQSGTIGLRAATPGPAGWGLDLVSAPAAELDAVLPGRDSVLVAEPYAFRQGIEPGEAIDLPTPDGPRSFEVAGIYRDYNTSGTSLTLALDTYRRHWRDERISGIGVHLRPDSDSSAAAERVRSAFPAGTRMQIRSTEAIERLSLAVFDRTFQVTEVLRLLAGLVAFLGVLSALLAIQLEREREFAVLRSIGMSARELARQVLAQTGLLGLAAGGAAIPLGCVLAALLVHVINRRSFGWSMDFVVSAGPLLQGLVLAVGAALLAGIFPAVMGARVDLNVALRDE